MILAYYVCNSATILCCYKYRMPYFIDLTLKIKQFSQDRIYNVKLIRRNKYRVIMHR